MSQSATSKLNTCIAFNIQKYDSKIQKEGQRGDIDTPRSIWRSRSWKWYISPKIRWIWRRWRRMWMQVYENFSLNQVDCWSISVWMSLIISKLSSIQILSLEFHLTYQSTLLMTMMIHLFTLETSFCTNITWSCIIVVRISVWPTLKSKDPSN